MAKSRSKPTMLDVATRAGVSQSTVSLILNAVEGARISAETRARVLEASRELGYRNLDAYHRPMTTTVGLTIDALSPNWIGAPLIDALRDECAQNGAQLMVSVTGEAKADQDAALDNLLRAHPMGLIVASIFPRAVEVPARLSGVPTVLVNAYEDVPKRPCILPDFYDEARIGIRHILDLGHRTIAFLNLEEWHIFTIKRQEAIRDLMGAAGIETDASLVRHLDGSPNSAFEATIALIRRRPDITAIVCASDRLAYGALDAATYIGRRPGQDIAIIGHDDMPGAAETSPPLTTVRTRVGQIARKAVATIISGRTTARVTTIKGKLVLRGTTMPEPEHVHGAAPAAGRRQPNGADPAIRRDGEANGGQPGKPPLSLSRDFKTLDRPSARQSVADKLAGLIASGVLSVGDELPSERDLAKAWQVGRETVRGGIRILVARNVLAVAHGTRTRVASTFLRDTEGTGLSIDRLNTYDIHSINGARLAVELKIVGLAAERIKDDTLAFLEASLAAQGRNLSKPVEFLVCDREFHFAIYEASGNKVLSDLVKDLYGYMMPNRVRVMGGQEAIATSIEDHKAIFAALRNRDCTATMRCFERHIERIYDSTLKIINE